MEELSLKWSQKYFYMYFFLIHNNHKLQKKNKKQKKNVKVNGLVEGRLNGKMKIELGTLFCPLSFNVTKQKFKCFKLQFIMWKAVYTTLLMCYNSNNINVINVL